MVRFRQQGESHDEYQFPVVTEPDEQGFHAYVTAPPGCHSFGDMVEEAQANIHEVMELHVEAMIEDGARET